jgi:hypothetical protein
LVVSRSGSRVDKAVFVDRYGRRRRAVIGAGLVVAALFVAWLALMFVGLAVTPPTS